MYLEFPKTGGGVERLQEDLLIKTSSLASSFGQAIRGLALCTTCEDTAKHQIYTGSPGRGLITI